MQRHRAHPRSRGENWLGMGFEPRFWGSSPLTRGKRKGGACRTVLCGLIPAHAGKTVCHIQDTGGFGAHPRSRGENSAPQQRDRQRAGSSPLTRGKPSPGPFRGVAARLIPAHAGKTRSVPLVLTIQRAHPRSRGENDRTAQFNGLVMGSSPLTRGKHATCGEDCSQRGLIPAHAGKTRSACQDGRCRRAHPRSRGENRPTVLLCAASEGSSPLTRGKPHRDRVQRHEGGLIPAHAGKTVPSAPSSSSIRAHPRSRGENAGRPARSQNHDGSSPLTRGKRRA